jgi:flagellar assembly protein FliH
MPLFNAPGKGQTQPGPWKELGETNPHNNRRWISEFQDTMIQGVADQGPTGQGGVASIWDLSSEQAYQLGIEDGTAKAKSELKTRLEDDALQILTKQRQQEAQHFQAALSEFRAQLDGHEQAIAQRLIALAVRLAEATIRQHIQTQADAVIPIVREAMKHCMPGTSPTQIFVCPEDEPVVRKALERELAEGIVVILIDAQAGRSDVRLIGPSSEIDQSLITRWNQTLIQSGIPPSAEVRI